METQNKTSAKDFFINLGAIVALYTTVVSLVNLLFSVINSAYPQITNGYNYSGSESISWPVSAIIIFFPIFLILMWLLAKDYKVNPEKQSSGIHKWLTYITLFIAGLTIAGDLITVLYYFLDGQELTTGFLLKILALLIIVSGIFSYYLHDVMGKLTSGKRNFYRVLASVIISHPAIAKIRSAENQRPAEYTKFRRKLLFHERYFAERFSRIIHSKLLFQHRGLPNEKAPRIQEDWRQGLSDLRCV
jgi:hypothetical protein